MTDQAIVTEEEAGELAEGYLRQLSNLIYQQGMYFLEIGRHLLIFRKEKLYEHLGYDNFAQFVSSPEISLRVSTAYAFCRLYEIYVLKFGFTQEELSGIAWSKLHRLASRVAVDDKKDAEMWLEKARSLGGRDFEIEIKEHKANEDSGKKIPFPHFFRCDHCGMWKYDKTQEYWCKCKDD